MERTLDEVFDDATLDSMTDLGRLALRLAGVTRVDQVVAAVQERLALVDGAIFADLAVLSADRTSVLVHVPDVDGTEERSQPAEVPLDAALPSTEAIRTADPVIVVDEADRCVRFPAQVDDARAAGVVGTATIPLCDEDRTVIGALSLGWAQPPPDHVVRRYRAVAELVAQALARCQRQDADRRAALELQRAFLPAHLPAIEGLEVATRYVPAEEGASVGGDWFDVLDLGHGRVALVIGDVMGHGLGSARAMVAVRHALGALLRSLRSPGAALAATNEHLMSLERGEMATAAVAVVDLGRREVDWALAGHPPPMLVGSGWSTLQLPPGPPLGSFVGSAYPVETGRWTEGHALMLCTDGAFERSSQSIDESIAAMAERVCGHADLETMVDEVVRGRPDRGDDLAVLAARLG